MIYSRGSARKAMEGAIMLGRLLNHTVNGHHVHMASWETAPSGVAFPVGTFKCSACKTACVMDAAHVPAYDCRNHAIVCDECDLSK
jgi:hypothetical protein